MKAAGIDPFTTSSKRAAKCCQWLKAPWWRALRIRRRHLPGGSSAAMNEPNLAADIDSEQAAKQNLKFCPQAGPYVDSEFGI